MPGETVVGRSSSCHITLEDPLVSRQHAVFRLVDTELSIRDLKSRNGVLVNGRPIHGERPLEDGDRVRLGTHELVVCLVTLPVVARRSHTPPTGFRWRCIDCGHLYPSLLDECPQCGSSTPREEETLTGHVPSPDDGWSLRLLSEVVERAVKLERWADVRRILDRARATLSDALADDDVDDALLQGLGRVSVALAEHYGESQWVVWVLTLCATRGSFPDRATLSAMERLSDEALQPILPSLSIVSRRAVERNGSGVMDSDCIEIVKRLANRATDGATD